MRGWPVIEDNKNKDVPIGWDVKLQLSPNVSVLVDEKARTRDWGDCLVEIIQDMVKCSPGWLYSEKDWVLYGSWDDVGVVYPVSLYLIKIKELRDYVFSQRVPLSTKIAPDGWGLTWNVVFQWHELISNHIAEKLL